MSTSIGVLLIVAGAAIAVALFYLANRTLDDDPQDRFPD